ncbi:BQ5605_C003g02372 [Microbotryum silenes-dioicae]|uniref:BQ5605_C003g02372 protein n=1 Tax=Microbotryum silenes-dioicae TaxID=796604 RepID=A0A2X0M5S5_9BASI|nr:BQ5605_C003g02372 [Microbotryum silenes-dioicae]
MASCRTGTTASVLLRAGTTRPRSRFALASWSWSVSPLIVVAPRGPIRSHQLNLSSSSRILVDRPPSFSTPDPSLASSSSPSQPKHDSRQPLDPAALPVEDYASPLLHTASFFGSIFRYAVYGSVSVVVVVVATFVGVHAYVEYFALGQQGVLAAREDPDEWASELEGWTGGHLGGGTDPRLGLITRLAVRGAWAAQNWGAEDPLGPASSASSTMGPVSMRTPFSGAGGTMIGSDQDRQGAVQAGLSQGEIRDAGWQLSEEFLVYALAKAAKKGISLVDRTESSSTKATVDRAALELEQRLANIRERIGGRYRLEAAREGWERIYYALVSSPASPSTADWYQREKLKATRKLGDLSARLAQSAQTGSEEHANENLRAERWYLGGILPALGAATEAAQPDKREALNPEVAEVTKAVSPSSSFFGFWSRSHPPSNAISSSNVMKVGDASSSLIRPEIAKAVNLLERGSSRHEASPATQRALLSSLISFETFLARRRALVAAHAVQNASLSYAELLMGPSSLPSPSTSSGGPTLSSATPASVLGPSLTSYYYSTRAAVLRTHLAEVSLALRMSNIEEYALSLLSSAIHSCDSTLVALMQSPLTKESSRKMRPFSKAAQGLVRDSRVTAAMACNLSGFVVENVSRIVEVSGVRREETKTWAEGGLSKSKSLLDQAVAFAKNEAGSVVDYQGLKLAEQGLKRVNAKIGSITA